MFIDVRKLWAPVIYAVSSVYNIIVKLNARVCFRGCSRLYSINFLLGSRERES